VLDRHSEITDCQVSNKIAHTETFGAHATSSAAAMPIRRQQSSYESKLQDDLSFPVPFREEAKYLDLANRFLALGGTRNDIVISIDSIHHFQRGKWKKKAA